MSGQTSTIPTAYDLLYTAIDGISWTDRSVGVTSDVQVEISTEVANLGREVVLLGQVRGEQEYTSIGARTRDEDYTIDLWVIIRWPGDTGLEALARAWQVWAEVESLLSSAPHITLGQASGVLWNELKTPVGTPTNEDAGAGYVIRSGVKVRSRIRP